MALPIIDVGCLKQLVPHLLSKTRRATATTTLFDSFSASTEAQKAAQAINHACRTAGFFYIKNYPMPDKVEETMDASARSFFLAPEEEKMRIAMKNGGRAWRGFFPVGGELTSGKPDIKEGLYFGYEAPEDDDRVKRGIPLFGKNLFPQEATASESSSSTLLKSSVLEYMDACDGIGRGLTCLISMGLGLPPNQFLATSCADPLYLFRIFHYPPPQTLSDPRLKTDPSLWGVGEHTDYGLVTLLKQDQVGGLEVRSAIDNEWITAPPVEGTLIVNVGDMLEAMTHGLYRSTPHRVKNPDPKGMRLSFPFFFDPGFEAEIHPLPLSDALKSEAATALAQRKAAGQQRWDGVGGSPQVIVNGTYGDYLMNKVGKVFPELGADHL